MKKRILFVDDEEEVLQGLRLSLRAQSSRWEMAFAQGGEAALEELASADFDVVVTDMRMPGIDGSELLRRTQQDHPETVRIVLSGYAEEEAILRSIPVAHQFLHKPCDAPRLQNVIERACNVQSLLDRPDIRAKVGTVDTLPALPRHYFALNKALAGQDPSVAAVAAIIEQDIGMSAKVLQIVNSAFFGLSRKLTNIREAILYLGMHVTKNLVLSVEIFRSFDKLSLGASVSLEALHRHSLLAARISRRLLEDLDEGKDAFAAAVLHDVGRLVLAATLPELYEASLEEARETGRPLHEVERELHGFGHAEVGAYLLGRWGLPYPIIEAVAYHHDPGRVKQGRFDLLSAVHVADILAHDHGPSLDRHAHDRHSDLDLEYLARLGVAKRVPDWHRIAEEQAQVPAIEV